MKASFSVHRRCASPFCGKRWRSVVNTALLSSCLSLYAGTSIAQNPPPGHSSDPSLEASAVIGASWQSAQQSLIHRDKGWGLGHSDVSIDARFAPALRGKLTMAAHSDHQRIETAIEEAYLDAPALPGGLQLRVGRFLSQLGYLNESHPHADDFVMRPLLHRALLGDHYFDDGLRLNWVAPSSIYWRTGVELLRGKRLPGHSSASRSVGAYSVTTRLGADIGRDHGWQIGLGMLRHRSGAQGPVEEIEHHDHADEEAHAEEGIQHAEAGLASLHTHSHGALYFGRRMTIAELVWKWAPGGNSKAQQLRLSAELARVGDLVGDTLGAGRHSARYLSVVYRFHPQWEVGARLDRLSVLSLHEEGYEPARLREHSLALAYKPTHSSALRLQWTTQRDAGGFSPSTEIAPKQALHLQFIQTLGAHGAHAF